MRKELEPTFDGSKSFYGKAFVSERKGVKTLFSYNTKVCYIYDDKVILNHKVKPELLFSKTTLRHVREFIAQELGITDLTLKELKYL